MHMKDIMPWLGQLDANSSRKCGTVTHHLWDQNLDSGRNLVPPAMRRRAGCNEDYILERLQLGDGLRIGGKAMGAEWAMKFNKTMSQRMYAQAMPLRHYGGAKPRPANDMHDAVTHRRSQLAACGFQHA